MQFQKITIIGVGLLGGSLGLAIRQRQIAATIHGYVRRSASIPDCAKHGVVDHATRDLAEAVRDADLIILCTPLSQMRDLSNRMVPSLKPGAIVTDVGSVKQSVVSDLEALFAEAGAHFIGSHPMAGGEKTSLAAAQPDLFEKAICVLTPTSMSDLSSLETLDKFWQMVGASVVRMSAERHDELVSRSSHLTHVIAAELANDVLSPAHAPEQALLCASGFRDTTRVASGSPEMWRDICLANQKNLSRAVSVFIEGLEEFRHALDEGDALAIEEFFKTARDRREAWRAQVFPKGQTPA